jgi:hypothetical protein
MKIESNTQRCERLIGKRVIVHFKGLMLTGKLIGLDPKFGGRDAIVQLPSEKKPRKFWTGKIEEIKP